MTLDRWLIPANELREMRYLGWYEEPGGERCRAPWIADDGGLDPDALFNSELFQGEDVEAVSDSLLIPSNIDAQSASIASYLAENGWNWLPDGVESAACPAWVARTATNAYFLFTRDSLLVDFGRFPRFDGKANCWAGSPLWAGFLLVCCNPKLIGPPAFPIDEPELWRMPLEHLAEKRPWLDKRALATVALLERNFAALNSHLTAARKQECLKQEAHKRAHLRPK
jgi:hypothetical protein